MLTVSGLAVGFCMKTSAISRSFHTPRNWKIVREASAGTESGRTMRKKIPRLVAPSIRAASINSAGRRMKKLRSRKIAKGRPKAVWASQIPTYD